jgi:DNA-directed RNA polymerase II subunit RPB2
MTVAQLVETVLSKAGCCEGRVGDGTPFREDGAIDGSAAILAAAGYESRGNETLFCAATGQPLGTSVFFGPCTYQRLRHMVVDKVHARKRGAVQLTTRQPVEGRSRGGGLRIGEMEKDALCAHGAAHVLLDRLLEQSDEFEVCVCRKCGLIAESLNPAAVTVARGDDLERCRNCRLSGPQHIGRARIPAAAKLFIQELAGLNIAARLRLEDAPAVTAASAAAPATASTAATCSRPDSSATPAAASGR